MFFVTIVSRFFDVSSAFPLRHLFLDVTRIGLRREV